MIMTCRILFFKIVDIIYGELNGGEDQTHEVNICL